MISMLADLCICCGPDCMCDAGHAEADSDSAMALTECAMQDMLRLIEIEVSLNHV